ncbi:hypothetical protein [Sphaerisporangium sp. TRM90804]|nr:hypothetical protein [Sphaerisporangium sp. TRM90804]MDH2424833.1 hypothetical protein [Sphaerisporangium sp. TRM90804]
MTALRRLVRLVVPYKARHARRLDPDATPPFKALKHLTPGDTP